MFENITSSLGKDVLENLSITDPIVLQFKKVSNIVLDNPVLEEIGEGWVNIDDKE
jgi:hypothetical protein